MNGLYQMLAVINRVGMGDGVDDGADGAYTGGRMATTEGLFTGGFNSLSEPTLVVSIIFILTAGSRHGSAGIVDGLYGSSSRAQGRILHKGGQKRRVRVYGGETDECRTNEGGHRRYSRRRQQRGEGDRGLRDGRGRLQV